MLLLCGLLLALVRDGCLGGQIGHGLLHHGADALCRLARTGHQAGAQALAHFLRKALVGGAGLGMKSTLLLLQLAAQGVDTCFANPGTTELDVVRSMETQDAVRCVIGLQENVCTGAADGYGRMLGRPAATLLHLGPGYGNGVANLHNARRAHTPVLNVIGDHATDHKKYDAPLESDIEPLTDWTHGWVRRTRSGADIGRDAAEGGGSDRRTGRQDGEPHQRVDHLARLLRRRRIVQVDKGPAVHGLPQRWEVVSHELDPVIAVLKLWTGLCRGQNRGIR